MNNLTPEMSQYLSNLPKSVQTAIIESGAEFDNLDQLKNVAKAYMGQ